MEILKKNYAVNFNVVFNCCCRFAEAAELLDVCWLEFDGKMHTQMLTQNTKYAAYMVFKIADHNYGLGSPIQEAIVEIGEIRSTRQVCLQEGVFSPDTHEHVQFPQERADGWMELAMGEFFNEGADNGEVSIILSAKHGGHWKKGLIVHGIEIRVNPSGSCQSDGSGEPDAHPLNSTHLNPAIGGSSEPDKHTPNSTHLNPAIDGSGEPDTHPPNSTHGSRTVGGTHTGTPHRRTRQKRRHPRFTFGCLLCFPHPSSVEGGASGSP